MMKILVAGGGTAGHISPVLAVIASIQKLNPSSEILFVCSGKKNEVDLLNSSNINYKIISSGKFRRYGRSKIREITDFKTQISNVSDLSRIARGYSQSRKIIKQFKPDVVFIKGGYVALPVGLAAKRMGTPYIIHESDSVMGQANKFLSKDATAIAVSFPKEIYPELDPSKLYFTGNPVRPEYYEPRYNRKVKEQKPNIMIFAGSQGSEAINNVVFDDIELFVKNFDLLHIAGAQGIERARYTKHNLPKELKKSYDPHEFLTQDMPAAYRWADIVVSRAGMNSLSELSAMSKAAIVIPLPGSANDHQYKNAEYLQRHGAIRMITQDELTGKRLMNEISKLASDSEAKSYLQESLHKLFRPNAASDLAKIILAVANSKRGGRG